MKKKIIIPTVLLGIIGGFAIAQTEIFTTAEKSAAITASEAKANALKAFKGQIVEFEYDSDDKVPHYDLEIVNDTEKAEVEVDATTGKAVITERESLKTQHTQVVEDKDDDDDKGTASDQTTTTAITKAQAIAIAQQQASGTVTKAKLDEDDGVQIYEIEIKNGNTEYEFDIHATTGAILKFEKDTNNDHDDNHDDNDDIEHNDDNHND